MVYEELVSSMEEAAEQKNREILERAGREADEIINETEKGAEAIRSRYMQDSARQAEVERNRQTYLATEEVKSAISIEKENLLKEAFLSAAENLKELRNTPGYPDLFKRLLVEAQSEVRGKEFVFHIDSRDNDLCREIIAELHLSAVIKPDLESAGGVVVSSSDERIVVQNTVESRLEKAKNIYRLDIIGELTGG